jgi:hypothetical protein
MGLAARRIHKQARFELQKIRKKHCSKKPHEVTAEELRGFLDKYSSEYTGMYREHIKDDWNQLTNRTKENFERFQQSRKKVAFWKSHIQLTALQLGQRF